ncbi:MAG: efflux transporter outer membrane subunit [Campylobacterales bacterium]|nr:efflux transporter outer membrane subunit [Campylobacterales bacterium]
MKSNTLLIMPTLALLVGGCAIGPDYARPKIDAPGEYRTHDANVSAESNATAIEKRWWSSFKDQNLTAAVDEAMNANFDIKVASSQIDTLLGQFDQAKSNLYPHINAGASYDRKGVRNSDMSNLNNGITSTYAASLTMTSYEIDLFGKVRRATEAARAMLLSGEYNKRATQLSIAASVASAYAALASYDAQIEAAKENLTAAQDIEKITKAKYDVGSLSETEWLQSVAQTQSASATLSQLEAGRIASEATFNTLLGRNPTRVSVSSIDSIEIPSVPSGIPSQILERRPDVAGAEQDLIAANAKIGVAKAAYFPSISLTGMLGNQSRELNKLFTSPARIWEVTPSISMPLFTAGLVEGQVKEAEGNKNQYLMRYQKAVVSAFNDADSSIGQNAKAKEQLEYNKKRSEAMQKAFEQAKLKYQVGYISYADMLAIQQNWLSARQQYVISKQNAVTSTVNLYKALGGGWDEKSLPDLPSFLPAGR